MVPALASFALTAPVVSAAAPLAGTPDYPGATWVPASTSNYTTANRPHDHPIQIIVIHDTEGSYATAIQLFQDPTRQASAHYVVSNQGQIAQMVQEKDIAWHAGNWDYNTRAIGIEHEGYAWTPNTFTAAEYQASAHIAASICSRYGVPMDRTHVIGHNEVPDPNNPGLYGGSDHHTDPGPYWNWTYYLSIAEQYASALPSPPHMMPDPLAVNGTTSATVTWLPAQTCQPAVKPITGYTVTDQPDGTVQNLPATATSATFNNLTPGTSYTFTVTATDADGQDSLTSNAVVPGRCNQAQLSASPSSPQPSATPVTLTGRSASCPHPLYEFLVQSPGSTRWSVAGGYSSSATFVWNSIGQPSGTYALMVRVQDANSPGNAQDSLGTYDDRAVSSYSVTPRPCTSVSVSASPQSSATAGATVTITGVAGGCPSPLYEFWMRVASSDTWQMIRPYSSNAAFAWNTSGSTGGGIYIGAWAKDASSTTTSFDANASIPYTIAAVPCGSVTISGNPASPQPSGTPVTFSARASGCPSALYEFWMRPASSDTWQLIQAYSTSNQFHWNSTGAAPGTVYFGVWAKDASSPTGGFDANASTPFVVSGTACTSAAISAMPTSAAHGTGARITFTGVASGCTNPNPLYEFWFNNGSSWQLVQGWSTSSTWTWNTTGAPAGSWQFVVWVRDAQSPGVVSTWLGNFDAYAITTYTLS